jgi:hypothetical protein
VPIKVILHKGKNLPHIPLIEGDKKERIQNIAHSSSVFLRYLPEEIGSHSGVWRSLKV